MKYEDKDTKDLFAVIFRRKGGAGQFLRPYDEMDLESQQKLCALARVSLPEEPIIGGIGANEWFVLSTRQVKWRKGDDCDRIVLSDISDVRADFRHMIDNRIFPGDLDFMEISSFEGKTVRVPVEAGSPWLGVFYILLNQCQRNFRDKRTSAET